MTPWYCLWHEFKCAEQLTPHEIEARTLVFGIWAVAVIVVPLVLQYVFKVPIWQGVKWIFSQRLVHKDDLPVVDEDTFEPSWVLSADRNYKLNTPNVELVKGRVHKNSVIYDIWIQATNTSRNSQNPQFVAHVFIPLHFLVTDVEGWRTIKAQQTSPSRIPGYLETGFTVHAPDDIGTSMTLGNVLVVQHSDGVEAQTIEFLYNITYFPRGTYPVDRMLKFRATLMPPEEFYSSSKRLP